jgi:hypothetical protein
VNKEKLGLSYIRFLYETSFHVTVRGYLPRTRALFVFFVFDIVGSAPQCEACSGNRKDD